jgi:hypothetical protein
VATDLCCSRDRPQTIKAGRVGLALGGAIALSSATLIDLGFKCGRKLAGYRGDYYTLAV